MERTPLNSEACVSAAYDAGTQVLEIEFVQGAVWQYTPVPPQTARAFLLAASPGRAFRQIIKGKFSEEQIE